MTDPDINAELIADATAAARAAAAAVCERRAEQLQGLLVLAGPAGPYAGELRRAVAELLRAAGEIRGGSPGPAFPAPPQGCRGPTA